MQMTRSCIEFYNLGCTSCEKYIITWRLGNRVKRHKYKYKNKSKISIKNKNINKQN